MGLRDVCKRSISLDERPTDFITCQWQTGQDPNGFYLVYRVLVAFYFVTTLLTAIIDPHPTDTSFAYRVKFVIYLTFWNYIVCTFQALLSAEVLMVCYFRRNSKKSVASALRNYKVYWVLQTLGLDLGFLVTTYYWAFVYDGKSKITEVNMILHIFNTLLMDFDLFMVSHPVRFLHVIYVLVFGNIYGAFTAIYFYAGGISREGHHYIYKPLDWTNPTKSVLVLLATTCFMMAIHTYHWALARFRVYLHGILEARMLEKHDKMSESSWV